MGKPDPALLGRLAGVAGAAWVALALVPGSLGGPSYGTSMSTPQIAAWASQHTRSFPVTGFIGGLSASVFALFLLLLVSAARGRGLLKSVVVQLGGRGHGHRLGGDRCLLRASRRGRRQQATGGVVALFSLNAAMTYTDGFVAGMAILALSLLQLTPRALPRPLIWLGALTGTYLIVSDPIQLAVSHGPAGADPPDRRRPVARVGSHGDSRHAHQASQGYHAATSSYRHRGLVGLLTRNTTPQGKPTLAEARERPD